MNTTHPQIPALEFSFITDGIYIGTNHCCQVHFDEQLLSKGITTNISLEGERVDVPFGVEYSVWIPTKDHDAPSPDQLELGVSTLEKLVALGKKVYVHCMNGHGRAPTLVAAYLVREGKSPEQAVELIRTKRPVIHLEDTQRAALEAFYQKQLK